MNTVVRARIDEKTGREAAAGAERRDRVMPTPMPRDCRTGPDSRNAAGASRRVDASGRHLGTMVRHRRMRSSFAFPATQ